MFAKFFTRKPFILTLAVIILVGCSKDEDPKTQLCYVTSYISTSGNNTHTATYSYDDKKIVRFDVKNDINGDVSEGFSTLVYDSKGNLAERIGGSGTSKDVYTYNSDNQLIKIEEFRDNDLKFVTELVYSGARLSKMQYHENPSGVLTGIGYDIYEYKNSSSKDPAAIKMYNENGSINSTYEFEYDDKKTPYAATGSFLRTRLLSLEGLENNVTKEILTIPGWPKTETTFAYEYNSEGYPVKKTATILTPNSSRTVTIVYTYNCS